MSVAKTTTRVCGVGRFALYVGMGAAAQAAVVDCARKDPPLVRGWATKINCEGRENFCRRGLPPQPTGRGREVKTHPPLVMETEESALAFLAPDETDEEWERSVQVVQVWPLQIATHC